MVWIIRKASLPDSAEVREPLRHAAKCARTVTVRQPRSAGFPLLFSAQGKLLEPTVAYLHEHFVQRGQTADTLRTYAEILYDWFETLEQNSIRWSDADAVDLVAYRNRMMQHPSGHTGRPYHVSTINHRVRGVLRFYGWAVRAHWLDSSALADKQRDLGSVTWPRWKRRWRAQDSDRSLFVLRQYESLPRPLASQQALELLAALPPPYDLMARWQIYTGLRMSELLRLELTDATRRRRL